MPAGVSFEARGTVVLQVMIAPGAAVIHPCRLSLAPPNHKSASVPTLLATTLDDTGLMLASRSAHPRAPVPHGATRQADPSTAQTPQTCITSTVAILAQQLTFEQAYGHQPAVTSSSSTKGSWLARVSHRASHIPATARTPTSPSAGGGEGTSAGGLSDTLPFRTYGESESGPAGGGGATTAAAAGSSYDQLERLASEPFQPTSARPRKTSSYPASPLSPIYSEFQPTPIDASFGDRVLEPEVAVRQARDRSSLPGQQRTRSGTTTQQSYRQENSMEKYARQAGDTTYDSDAEADDEFERSSEFMGPSVQAGYGDEGDDGSHPSESDDEHDMSVTGADTPTTQGWGDREGRSPVGSILQWTEEQVADYIASLAPSLDQYIQNFIVNGVNGDALVHLHHEELREMGILSVGHRLTILKAIHSTKLRCGVKVLEEDYVPLSAAESQAEQRATQDDIARVIESLRLRDQRIIAAEAELQALKQDLERISEENRKLREETLPIMRIMKDQRTPLPDPTLPSPRDVDPAPITLAPAPGKDKGFSLTRKFSKKGLNLSSANLASKQPSPTYPPQHPAREVRDDGGDRLEASAAAQAASNHLTASMTSQTSPNSVHGQLSPTSPAYNQISSSGHHQPQSARLPGSARGYGHVDSSHWSQASDATTVVEGAAVQRNDRSRRQAPTPSPREDEPPGSARGERERGGEKDNPVEIFKSFRVGIEDPCRVVLPVALKRYNITDDWRQYALYIVHGDQERCLGLQEKPLMLFKQLEKEGRKPMFMLRRHASPQEGWTGTNANYGQENQQKGPVMERSAVGRGLFLGPATAIRIKTSSTAHILHIGTRAIRARGKELGFKVLAGNLCTDRHPNEIFWCCLPPWHLVLPRLDGGILLVFHRHFCACGLHPKLLLSPFEINHHLLRSLCTCSPVLHGYRKITDLAIDTCLSPTIPS
nr:protein ste50 [Quercus suber]